MNKIVNCLLESNYYIPAIPSNEGTELQLTYPASVIFEHKVPETVITYKMTGDGVQTTGPGTVTKFYRCSEYSHRTVIWALILRRCMDMQVTPDIILVKKEDGNFTTANELMSVLKAPKNTKKESIIASVLAAYLMGSDEYDNASQLGVPKSYRLLLEILCGD